MGLNTENQSNYTAKPLPTQGVTLAVCYAIIDKGVQEKNYGRGPQKNAIVEFAFEIPGQTHVFDEKKGPQPLAIFQEYTVSAYAEKAKLPKVLKTWGKLKNDISKISPDLLKKFVGAPCMLTIEHYTGKNGKVYARIAMGGLGVSPRMDGLAVPLEYPKNPRMFFDLDSFSWDLFAQLPEFKRKEIMKCDEWNGIIVNHPMPAAIQSQLQTENKQNNTNQASTESFEKAGSPVVMDNGQGGDDPAF